MRFVSKLVFICVVGSSFADGISSLDQFFQAKNQSICAEFTQTVFIRKKKQVTVGQMKILRPNKFRWEYYNQGNNIGQQIVSDGNMVYIVDKELEQVTYKKLGKTFNKSPAMILAGSNDIRKYYTLSNKADRDNNEWVELKPKLVNDNNGFQAVEIGFSKSTHQLANMIFVDNFGSKSQISFHELRTGIKFRADEFKFVLPKGYDTINSD